MTIKAFRPNIGLMRLGKGVRLSQAAYTQQTRAQLQELKDNFSKLFENIDTQSAQIVAEALEPTFEKSQIYVPVKSGDLKASGYLESSSFRGHATVEIGYGKGGEPPYAVFVHEMPIYHAPPTQDKFLQRPLEEDAEQIAELVQQGFKIAAGLG